MSSRPKEVDLQRTHEQFIELCAQRSDTSVGTSQELVTERARQILNAMARYSDTLVRRYTHDEVTVELSPELLQQIRNFRSYLQNLQRYAGYWAARSAQQASKDLDRAESLRIDIQAHVEAFDKYLKVMEEQTDDVDIDRRLKEEIAYRRTRATIGKLLEQFAALLENLARNI